MAVNVTGFSDVLANTRARDRDVVTVTRQNQVKLGQSRFRLVRWLVGSGIGKRLRNRRTVAAFVSSLRNNFGNKVVDKMNLSHLEHLHSKGKPLDVRHVRAYLSNAREVKEHLDVRSEQQGSGGLSADAAKRMESELTRFTSTERDAHQDYPDFFDGAVKDYGRTRYVIAGEEMHKDEGKTVQAFTDLCRDAQGQTDKKLLTVVQGMLYQRIFGIMLKACIGPQERNAENTHVESPFKGCFPAGGMSGDSCYRARRDPASGKLLLEATHNDPVRVISHAASNQTVLLDPAQSYYSMHLQLEVDPEDYHVTMTRADYQFRFTPLPPGEE